MTQSHQTIDHALAMLFCCAGHRAAAEAPATGFYNAGLAAAEAALELGMPFTDNAVFQKQVFPMASTSTTRTACQPLRSAPAASSTR